MRPHETAASGLPRLEVAEATEEDVAAIAAFFWEGWRDEGPDAPGWSGATEAAIRQITEPEAIRARIGGPRRMFLASLGSRVVGFAATRALDDSAAELAGIVVLGEARGRGAGTRLLHSAIEAALAAGFRQMSVKTETTNARALQFYRENGFVETGSGVEDVDGTQVEVAELARSL